MPFRIELLERRHDRAGFDCGQPALNEFLRSQAGQQQRRGFGTTYVALAADGVTVMGFVTVSVGQVASQVLPAPRKLPRYPASILRIGRLAVDLRVQGQGLGRDLLAFALRLALDFSARAGLYAVVVDAKDERAAAFYRHLGFAPVQGDPLCLFLPVATLTETSLP